MSDKDVLERALRESMEREYQRAPVVDLAERSVRRARQLRARRRLVTGAVVALALVAAAPVALGLGGRDGAEHRPVATDPPPAYSTIAAEPLLTRDDLNPVGRATVADRFETASVVQGLLEVQCLDALPLAQAEARPTGFWPGDSADVVEVVLQLPAEADARSLVDSHRSLPDHCGRGGAPQQVHQPTPVDVEGADEAMTWTIDGTKTFGAVGLARTGNVVVVLTLASTSDPLDGGWDTYAARTLALAFDRAV